MSKSWKTGALLIAALVGVSVVFVHFGWPGQLYAHWHNSWYGNQASDKNIWLPDYKVAIEGKPIPGITDLSGLAYDPANDRISAIKERDPRQLYSITGMLGSIGGQLQIRIKDLTTWVDRGVFSKDLSEGYYDPRTGHLLLPQAEGMTMDNKGELYIVSEPNLFYRFSQTKAGLSASAEKH